VNGTLQALRVDSISSTSSTARFSSRDGSVAIGLATTSKGSLLVRWDASGEAVTAVPPEGTSVDTSTAINPAGTAAVGSLSFRGNRAPYLWTLTGGFTVLPEDGRALDYDLSEALDVSDDGTVVVGTLQASVILRAPAATTISAGSPRYCAAQASSRGSTSARGRVPFHAEAGTAVPMTATTRCVRRSPPSCVSSTSIVSLGLAPVAMASMAAAARCELPFANCRID